MKCLLAGLFILAYVGATGWFLFRHLLGDSYSQPAAYFWTWDMYPGYRYFSERRTAIGETASGKYLTLLPSPQEQFRWGNHGDLARYDLDRSGALFRRLAEQYGRAEATGDDPVRTVSLIEEYWPVRFNLPEELYFEEYGLPHPHRRYWRVVETIDLTEAADGNSR